MRLIALFLIASSAQLTAQTTNPPAKPAAVMTAAPAKTSAPLARKATTAAGCATLPTLSPKIPALAAGLPCPKPLYTIRLNPQAELTYVSPLESPTLREDLGIPALNTFTLSYVDTKIGTGPLAVKHKWYSLKYTGYLTDGTVFDASSKHPDHDPFVFQQGPSPQGRRQVIVGWDTGIDGMRIGGKRRLFIPNELAYGPNGNPAGGIPPKSWLIFDIELVAQNDTDPSPKVITPLPTPAGTTTAPSTGAGTGAAPTPNKVSAAPTVAPKPVQAPTPTQAPAAPTPPAPKP